MSRLRQGQVRDEYDRAVPGASVYVYNSSGTDASITIDGTVPLTPPVSSDEFGVYSYYAADGIYREDVWYGAKLRSREILAIGSADTALFGLGVDARGDTSLVLSGSASKRTQYFSAALTANRTVTMPAPGNAGRRYRIVRAAAATGAFNLTVQTSGAVSLKVLNAASSWCDVEDDGTEFRLMAAGSL